MTNSKAVTDRYLPPPSEAQMYWYNHLKPHQASGLSLVEYAKQKNLSKNTLNYWSQLWRIPKEIGQPEMALFQSVQIESVSLPAPTCHTKLTVRLPNQIQCELQLEQTHVLLEVMQSLAAMSL